MTRDKCEGEEVRLSVLGGGIMFKWMEQAVCLHDVRLKLIIILLV